MVDLSIITINWNQKALTEACLTSIVSETTEIIYEIWVVDNGSQDGSAAAIREKFPSIHLIENRENLGFGRANNLAFPKTIGEYVLLFNNDARLPLNSHTFDHVIKYLRAHPAIDIAGPKIVSPEGIVDTTCCPINVWTQFLWEILPPLKPLYRWWWLWKYGRTAAPQKTEGLMGACIFIKKKVLEDVGYFDEQYFLYAEETDWCKRAHQKGYSAYYLPQFTVEHIGHASGRGENFPPQFFHFYKSKNLFLKKFWPPMMARAISLLMFGGILFRFGVWTVLSVIGFRREKAGIMRRAIMGVLVARKEIFLF